MPFADNFRNASIYKGTLTAESKKNDGKTWISSSINLDEFIGNIDGKFVLGGKGFSASAQDITLADGVVAAKLKNAAGKYVDAKFDLSTVVQSQDGIIAHSAAASRGGLERTLSSASSASAASSMSSASMSSMASEMTRSTSMTSHTAMSRSSSTFSSSKFRYHSQQLLLEETCSNFVLKGSFLHCDIHHEDGRVSHASFDLDLCIGDVDGRLVWDAHGFCKTCTDIHLDGFFLVARCHNPANREEYHIARLDIRTRLRVQGSVIIFVETNKKLSMMLSEVPWMKFKVIAEPDLSVFGSHPVIKQTMTRVAESTVEHVTKSMHAAITTAMEVAIVEITASAMKHIALQMEHSVQDAVGYAAASPSATESEFLHMGALGGMYGGGFNGWAADGHAHGKHDHSHSHNRNGYAGGASAGWSNGASSQGVLSRSVSESSSASMSSTSSSSSHSDARSQASGYTVNGTQSIKQASGVAVAK
ncbi:hypothetical protein D9619_011376 [Psilocybe cf. subviscida]|uniref:Cyanovirin-N domain-containing protein n=1 Tax=Psilocybe cf. subviscida TaxID=2480587 RepID=A0A8H5BJP2_9AGAR|nr:hypothetical protein D9619_011376 [Psilocybe cf. subviscida]